MSEGPERIGSWHQFSLQPRLSVIVSLCSVADPIQTVMDEERTDWIIAE